MEHATSQTQTGSDLIEAHTLLRSEWNLTEDGFVAADQSQPYVMCIDSFQLIDINIVGQYSIQPTVWLTVITH